MFFADSNIIIDVWNENSKWCHASTELLSDCANKGIVVINSIVFAEISIPFDHMRHCSEALEHLDLIVEAIPMEAAFLAGKSFLEYKRTRGAAKKQFPLPDFFIGAHAAIQGYTLITRDHKRFKKYFPKLNILTP